MLLAVGAETEDNLKGRVHRPSLDLLLDLFPSKMFLKSLTGIDWPHMNI